MLINQTLQGFIQDFFSLGGNVHVHITAVIVSVCVNMPYLEGSGGMPPRKIFKFTTSETVSDENPPKLMRIAIESPELESVNFEETLDIL